MIICHFLILLISKSFLRAVLAPSEEEGVRARGATPAESIVAAGASATCEARERSKKDETSSPKRCADRATEPAGNAGFDKPRGRQPVRLP